MTAHVVSDEQLGILAKRQNDLSRRLIDCDAAPFIPEGMSIKPEDQLPGAAGGQVEFDASKVLFHIYEGQKDGKEIVGNILRWKLAGKALLKANVLDHLLANTNLIPEAWKTDEQGRTRYLSFWGTVYRASNGTLYIRYLYWRDGRWKWHYSWLHDEYDDRSPAAVLAS